MSARRKGGPALALGTAASLLLLLPLLAGCASTDVAQGGVSMGGLVTSPPGYGEALAACPMLVPGTTVSMEEPEGAAALGFTTPTGDVERLRESAMRMAQMHNQAGGVQGATPGQAPGCPARGVCPGCPLAGQGGTGGLAPGEAAMAGATAAVENIDGGARLVLRPRDESGLAALRQQVSEQARRMTQARGCPTELLGGPPQCACPSGQ